MFDVIRSAAASQASAVAAMNETPAGQEAPSGVFGQMMEMFAPRPADSRAETADARPAKDEPLELGGGWETADESDYTDPESAAAAASQPATQPATQPDPKPEPAADGAPVEAAAATPASADAEAARQSAAAPAAGAGSAADARLALPAGLAAPVPGAAPDAAPVQAKAVVNAEVAKDTPSIAPAATMRAAEVAVPEGDVPPATPDAKVVAQVQGVPLATPGAEVLESHAEPAKADAGEHAEKANDGAPSAGKATAGAGAAAGSETRTAPAAVADPSAPAPHGKSDRKGKSSAASHARAEAGSLAVTASTLAAHAEPGASSPLAGSLSPVGVEAGAGAVAPLAGSRLAAAPVVAPAIDLGAASGGLPAPDVDQLAARTVRWHRLGMLEGGGSTRIRLTPPELGSVQVSLRTAQSVVHVQLVVEGEGVRQLLQAHSERLVQSLQAQGLQPAQIEVLVQNPASSRGDQGEYRDGGQPGQGQGQGQGQPQQQRQDQRFARQMAEEELNLTA